MAFAMTQKEIVLVWKKETFLNIAILCKLHPMSSELSRYVFKENVLEKPTQNFLNHLCYYLVSIIDRQVSASFSWPLYDTKTEKLFRNELGKFISDYSNKGLLAPVLTSYLVNPSSYRVQKLLYQMSQLAVQRTLIVNMKKDSKKTLYTDMSEKYKSNNKEGFIEEIEQITEVMLSKFSNYLKKREVIEKIAELFRNKIMEMEEKLVSTKAVEYINVLVDNYINTNELDEEMKNNILSVKDVNNPSKFFDDWLQFTDKVVDEMEKTWALRIDPLLDISQKTYDNTKTLISRYAGEMDKKLYMIEYNPKVDDINTKDLETQVNSEQKYILKNIVKEDRLNFPNLVRGFLIAISFILKNAHIDNEICNFNDCLENGTKGYEDMLSTLKVLISRILNTEANLQINSETSILSISPAYKLLKSTFEIPVLPDLSDIRSNRHHKYQISFDTFTPLSTSKHQFNLLRRSTFAYSKPRSQSLFAAPFYQAPQDVFMKSLISYPVNSCGRLDMTHNFHNLSVVPQLNRANETIAECGTGFTKQQIMRLLSTKKTSSSKKHKYNTIKPDAKVVRPGLFNESSTSNESSGLFRSYSSPNLFENREQKHFGNIRKRRLSIMAEDYLEVSGISALDSKTSTPQGIAESSRELETANIPAIIITPAKEAKINKVLQEMEKEIEIKEDIKSQIIEKTETPKTNPPIIKKTSSLEKIINRFKKVRASVLPEDNNLQEMNHFRTIVEEKENLNMGNAEMFNAKKFLLPDLLSPSCSVLTQNSDYLDQIVMNFDNKYIKESRQSLGTALGVDDTFLDQCDFID